MGEVATIGLDVAKSVFQVPGVDIDGAVVIRKRVSRAKVLEFFAIAIVLLTLATSTFADTTVTDVVTLVLDGATYKLDGIDGPETNQLCLNDRGERWQCGIEARDRLRAFVGKRDVRCEYVSRDKAYPRRSVATCWVHGETVSLNQWLVHEGWALNFEPNAKGRFQRDQDDAQKDNRGLWDGCFVAPNAYRRGRTAAILLGRACGEGKSAEIRKTIMPLHPAMPPGCSIKGNYSKRAVLSAHRGIYHLEGCRSYGKTIDPDRWFCSEEEAQAEGFRKALTCLKSSR